MFNKNEHKIEHGEKKVFGSSIKNLDMDEKYTNVPVFVTRCIDLLEEESAITTPGLYRQSGNKTIIDDVRKKINQGSSKNKRFNCLKDQDVNTLTGMLKQFFRELEETLIPEEQVMELLNSAGNLAQLGENIRRIPEPQFSILKYLVRHLERYVFSMQSRFHPQRINELKI